MKINQLLTPYNFTAGTIQRIKYIVIHYVGATGGAEANCKYYAAQNRGASAHYFVGFAGEIWQAVEDKNVAWHCGGKKYANTKGGTYHGICTNANSIGIEMCVRNRGSQADTSRDWYFEEATVASAIELTKALMQKYNIPADHVIRHYDVTGKICPNPYVMDEEKWKQFKAAIGTPQEVGTAEKKEEVSTTPKIESAKSRNTQLSGTYTVTASGLHIRSGSGLNKSSLGILSRGSFVRCYGYYTEVNGVKWLYVTGGGLTGFCCSNYLKKL